MTKESAIEYIENEIKRIPREKRGKNVKATALVINRIAALGMAKDALSREEEWHTIRSVRDEDSFDSERYEETPRHGEVVLVHESGIYYSARFDAEYPPVFTCEFNDEIVSVTDGMMWKRIEERE